jgi:hypothetical protein
MKYPRCDSQNILVEIETTNKTVSTWTKYKICLFSNLSMAVTHGGTRQV